MAAWPQPSGAWALWLAGVAVLAGCSTPPAVRPLPQTTPGAGSEAQRDGPPLDPPADLRDRPDPEPRVEAIRSGGPNKPYEVLGERYTPLGVDEPVSELGLASWYGRKFHGRRTASGEVYDMYASSAAHRTMPLPSYARVRNPANGREVVVRVNDRGPFHKSRIIDLSYAAALKLGVLNGVAPVQVMRLTHEDIRTGRWRGETALVTAATVAPAQPTAAAPTQSMGTVADPAASPMAPGTTGGTPRPEPAMVAAPSPAPAPAPAPALASPGVHASAEPQPLAKLQAQAQAQAQATAPTQTAAGFWVQLGAFRQPQSASELRQQLLRELAWVEPWLAIFDDNAWFKLQAGPFASRAEALGMAARLRGAAAVQPLILQRR